MKKIDLPSQPDRYDIEREKLLSMEIRDILPDVWAELTLFNSSADYQLRIPLFSTHVTLKMPEGTLEVPDARSLPFLMRTLVLHYLCHHSSSYPSGRWVQYCELPGGMFYAATLEQNYRAVANRFGSSRNAIEDFKSICVSLGGEQYRLADAAFILKPLPKTPIIIALYRGDDEFPPNARVLLDERTTNFLDIDFTKLMIVATLGILLSLGKERT